MSLPLTGFTSRRMYSATTDDNKPPSSDDKKAEDQQAATNEEKTAPPSPEDEMKLKLAEKDKKLAELQVSFLLAWEKLCGGRRLYSHP
jgi:hypothetical protein